ncbi:hypothetical protein HK405_014203 [Cladochytrium tenue]|nr:hypothetical protein HK405_014203 [Cladochytrium tenue]
MPATQSSTSSTTALPLLGRNAVVVGGTRGIGGAVAELLAAAGASVLVAGSDPATGAAAVERLRAVAADNQQQRLEFRQLDASSMVACKEFADAVAAEPAVAKDGLHVLVMSAGHVNVGSRKETREGLEMTFALNYLSKFVVTNRLLPSLRRANDARVVYVLAGGNGGALEPDDLQLSKSFSFVKAAGASGALVDVLTKHLADEHKASASGPSFYHVFPGVVNTSNVYSTGLPRPVAFVASLAMGLLGRPVAQAADDVFRLASAAEFAASAPGAPSEKDEHGLYFHAGLAQPKLDAAYAAKLADDELTGRVWAASLEAAAAVGAPLA